MTDNGKAIASEFMAKNPPETLDPTTIPPLWGSMAPGGYRTPPYTLGWRITPHQLQAFLDPDCTKPTIPVNIEIRCITPRWRAFGYGKKYCGLRPTVRTIPAWRDDVREDDLIVYFSSNASKKNLEAVRGPRLQEVTAAVAHTLNLPDDLVPDLKWYGHFRKSAKQN
ncbi:hypothetical protein PC9H_002153 [Pleurotus ostreatus]|uniref:Uncharacterized protein n=1 Tax=Pleurotus ostreatus TaxID=5322 RepID=A0A8H6ZKC5_PLEOS|nr:uncharacterized protein PC9H_002153 [Pleurotus ostreatus]KAF7419562.1 hypothetical protein PC9H_002153 [Pleurotus ostreatus]KAJ8689594.1 hypothetical protein PTI98_012484 [Pleurotus ostreatus]